MLDERMAMGVEIASKKTRKSLTRRLGSLAERKCRRISSSEQLERAISYNLLASMNSSKISVQSTTVLGVVTGKFS